MLNANAPLAKIVLKKRKRLIKCSTLNNAVTSVNSKLNTIAMRSVLSNVRIASYRSHLFVSFGMQANAARRVVEPQRYSTRRDFHWNDPVCSSCRLIVPQVVVPSAVARQHFLSRRTDYDLHGIGARFQFVTLSPHLALCPLALTRPFFCDVTRSNATGATATATTASSAADSTSSLAPASVVPMDVDDRSDDVSSVLAAAPASGAAPAAAGEGADAGAPSAAAPDSAAASSSSSSASTSSSSDAAAAVAAGAVEEEPLLFCPNCNNLWRRNAMPPLCYMNGLESGPTPAVMLDLTAIERSLLALVQVFLTLVPLPVGGLWSRRNLYIFVPCLEQIEQLQNELPATGHIFVTRPRSNHANTARGAPLVCPHSPSSFVVDAREFPPCGQMVRVDRLRAAFEWLQRANPFYHDIAWNSDRLPMAVTMVGGRVSADRSSINLNNEAARAPSSSSRATDGSAAAAAAAARDSNVVVTDEYRLAIAMDVPVLDPYAAVSDTAAAGSTDAAASAAACVTGAVGGDPASAAHSSPAAGLAAADADVQQSGDELNPQAGPLSRSAAALSADPPVPMADVDDGAADEGAGRGGGHGGEGGDDGAGGSQPPQAPTLELQWQQSHPLAWLQSPGTEEKAFPRLFPYGVGGFRTARDYHLPLTRYFHTRLISTDSKFRREPEYLLWAEASLRHKEVLDAVHLALRRVPTGIVLAPTHTHRPQSTRTYSALTLLVPLCTGRGRRPQRRSNEASGSSALGNGGGGDDGAAHDDEVHDGRASAQVVSPAPLPTAGEVRRSDAWMTRYGGLHYLNRVRGTVPYWNSVRLELTAMIAQLGPPAIFLTLNPPRPREWPEFFVEIRAFGPNTTIDMVCPTRTDGDNEQLLCLLDHSWTRNV
jgi:hypothetical protein